jgi:hypothetical protein
VRRNRAPAKTTTLPPLSLSLTSTSLPPLLLPLGARAPLALAFYRAMEADATT